MKYKPSKRYKSQSIESIKKKEKDTFLFIRLILFLLTISPIMIFRNEEGEYDFIVMICVFLALAQINIIEDLLLFIFAIFPSQKAYFRSIDKFLWRRRVLYIAQFLFWSGVLLLYFQYSAMSDILYATRFFVLWGGIGLVLGALCLWCLKYYTPSVFSYRRTPFMLFLGFLIGLLCLFSSLACWVNARWADKEMVCNSYILKDKMAGGVINDAYYFFITTPRVYNIKIEVTKNLYKRVTRDENFEVCTRKGKLGFDIVAAVREE